MRLKVVRRKYVDMPPTNLSFLVSGIEVRWKLFDIDGKPVIMGPPWNAPYAPEEEL